MKQLYTLHKRARKFSMPSPTMDYNQKCCALKLLPLDKQLFHNKCVLMQKVVHGKAPQYLKDLMIPSQRLHRHGNKQLLPRTRTDIFKTSFSFSGSLAWNSLSHHLRYPMEVKTFKRHTFQALTKLSLFLGGWLFVCFVLFLHFNKFKRYKIITSPVFLNPLQISRLNIK